MREPVAVDFRITELHDAAVERGEPGYTDPYTGLFVFTAAYHLARGECCDSGCRHCPFGDLGEPGAVSHV
ncbi:MAG TPA: DUF5522 domain-containing protein [Acidimicrobiales bacterium]|nr:DUF5522 domain-containing protein [Acidimicrobiales bacterium]